jgi:hypothetical protein
MIGPRSGFGDDANDFRPRRNGRRFDAVVVTALIPDAAGVLRGGRRSEGRDGGGIAEDDAAAVVRERVEYLA